MCHLTRCQDLRLIGINVSFYHYHTSLCKYGLYCMPMFLDSAVNHLGYTQSLYRLTQRSCPLLLLLTLGGWTVCRCRGELAQGGLFCKAVIQAASTSVG